jgi:hypothetical protein
LHPRRLLLLLQWLGMPLLLLLLLLLLLRPPPGRPSCRGACASCERQGRPLLLRHRCLTTAAAAAAVCQS